MLFERIHFAHFNVRLIWTGATITDAAALSRHVCQTSIRQLGQSFVFILIGH
jgi:hypothetical protein